MQQRIIYWKEARYQIYALLREGFSKRYIAQHAHKLALRRHCSNPKTILPETWNVVKCCLQLQWSPEQIASHAAVSLHSVYRHIQQDKKKGGTLYQHLRFRNQRKKVWIS